jgi:hypothetical protein
MNDVMRWNVYLLIFMLAFPAILLAQADQNKDVWLPLRVLEGVWEGRGDGMSGSSSVIQTYQFILNGKFLQMKTKSIFKPQEKNLEGEIHEDLGIFSFDNARKRIILRGFYVEGFVNQYVLNEISEDGKTFSLSTEQIENAPEGTLAKLVFKVLSSDEIDQSFYVAFPGQEYTCFSVNRLKRKK